MFSNGMGFDNMLSIVITRIFFLLHKQCYKQLTGASLMATAITDKRQ